MLLLVLHSSTVEINVIFKVILAFKPMELFSLVAIHSAWTDRYMTKSRCRPQVALSWIYLGAGKFPISNYPRLLCMYYLIYHALIVAAKVWSRRTGRSERTNRNLVPFFPALLAKGKHFFLLWGTNSSLKTRNESLSIKNNVIVMKYCRVFKQVQIKHIWLNQNRLLLCGFLNWYVFCHNYQPL